MKRQLPIWLQIIVLVLLCGGAAGLWLQQDSVAQVLAAFTAKPDTERGGRRSSSAVPVVVGRVTTATDDTIIEAVATARARRSVTLLSEAAGEVVSFGIEAGQRVAAGETILELDSSATRLDVEMAEVRLADAQTRLDRAGHLADRNVNSQATVDDARVVLDQARVALKQAQEALSRRTLRAPFEGIVGIPKVEIGDRITDSTPVITVDDRSEMIVEIDVAERFIARVSPGQPVVARTPGFPGRTFSGEISRIDTRIDPTSRTVKVRATLPNTDDLLRPGMSFAVELHIPGPVYPEIPELALQWGKDESYVWRIVDETAERVTVRSVRRLNDSILVDGPLREDDLVVVEGVQRPRPGRAVRFANPDAAPTS